MSKTILKTLFKNKLNNGRQLRYLKPALFVPANGQVVAEGAYPTACPTHGQTLALQSEIDQGMIEIVIITNLETLTVEEHNKVIAPEILEAQKATKQREINESKNRKKSKKAKPNVVSGNNAEAMLKSPDEPDQGKGADPTAVVGSNTNAFATGSIDENSPDAIALTSEHEASAGPEETVDVFKNDEGNDKAEPEQFNSTGKAAGTPVETKDPTKKPAPKKSAKKTAPKKTAAKKKAPAKKDATAAEDKVTPPPLKKKAAPAGKRKRGAAPKKAPSS